VGGVGAEPSKRLPEKAQWISTAEEANLPHVHSFIRVLRLDQDAVRAALTSEHHNGGTEGVNTKTKLIKRQMYGRAGFHLICPASSSNSLTLRYNQKLDRVENRTVRISGRPLAPPPLQYAEASQLLRVSPPVCPASVGSSRICRLEFSLSPPPGRLHQDTPSHVPCEPCPGLCCLHAGDRLGVNGYPPDSSRGCFATQYTMLATVPCALRAASPRRDLCATAHFQMLRLI
jgi:hypothetical protein